MAEGLTGTEDDIAEGGGGRAGGVALAFQAEGGMGALGDARFTGEGFIKGGSGVELQAGLCCSDGKDTSGGGVGGAGGFAKPGGVREKVEAAVLFVELRDSSAQASGVGRSVDASESMTKVLSVVIV